MRLFLCGITSNETKKISDLIDKTKDYVDGYVWCVDSNSNSDETFELLEKNKKEGKIVRHYWWDAHDAQMNEFLHCGALKEGDFYWIFDSSECPTEKWLKEVRKDIQSMKNNNIGIIGCSGRAYLAEFQDTNLFQFSPHWMLTGMYNRKMMLIPEDKKSEFIINKRDLSPEIHYQEHDTKYFLYARSNQIQAFYGKYGPEVVDFHERGRIWFRNYLKSLGYEANLKGFEQFLLKGEFSHDAKQIIDQEFCLSEYYRRFILKEDFITSIVPKREKWSFLNYIQFGDGFYDKNYLGSRLRYDKFYNIKD